MVKYDYKDKYTVSDLLEIIHLLRSPDGCPWDKVQTNESIRLNVLEEAYEAADAIDKNDDGALCEELGDLLMQIAFHADIARDENRFDFDDVADGVCKKLIHRHPHVFADGSADTPEAVLKKWDEIKQQEKSQTTATDTLRAVPDAFPALMRAQKVQKRAKKAGFDWDNAQGAWDKLSEEAAELKQAAASGDRDAVSDELGDLLFSAVNVSRFVGADAEDSLNRATDKFIDRFAKVEQLCIERGVDMKTASIDELDKLWDEAKKQDS